MSNKNITRTKAMQLIIDRMVFATDVELESSLEKLGFGNDIDFPYYGHNFKIVDEKQE